MSIRAPKPVIWVGSAKKDLMSFPKGAQRAIGTALLVAQYGGRPAQSKTLKGEIGGLVEIIENYEGSTYRAVYTVKLSDYIYVLHCFQKKSKTGIKTPLQEITKIKDRLGLAIDHFEALERTRH